MLKNAQDAWSDEKIETTVNSHYVFTFIGLAAEQPIPETVDSSGCTYAELIVAKAKRLFLTCIDIGVPHEITRLIDEFYDDSYLPFAIDEVSSLRLSHGTSRLDQFFYRQQFKYHVRVLHEGEHIRYARVEYAPFQVLEQKAANGTGDAPEKVRLPAPVNKAFIRRQLSLDNNQVEVDFLREIAAAKPLSHEHLLSIYGSYTHDDQMFILLSPSTKFNLKSFLDNTPKSFEALPKIERRKHLLLWPHCLANALAWLHLQGAHHGAVRPSRVLIDEQFHISLGDFEGDWLLASPTVKGDLEAYSYAAPEFWKRGLTVQSQGTRSGFSSSRSAGGRLRLPAHGEDGRRSSYDGSSDTAKTIRSSEEGRYTFVPTSRGNTSRLKLKQTDRLSAEFAPYVRNTESRLDNRTRPSDDSSRPKRALSRRLNALSMQSSISSDTGKQSEASRSKLNYAVSAEAKTTMVQAWKSTAHDMPAADMFGLGCVTMDICSILCGRSVSAFAKHRASKNRQGGRGGGLADASFHANLSQVMSWAETLLKDAEKKVKKENGQIFQAVEPILQTMIQCFDREPTQRPKCDVLALQLQKHLFSLLGSTNTHCAMKTPDSAGDRQKQRKRVESRLQVSMPPEGTAYATQSSSKRDSTEIQFVPRAQYYELASSTDHAPSRRDLPPDTPMRVSPNPVPEDDTISDELFDYYENHWKSPTIGRQPAGSRAAPGRVYRDFTEEDDNEITPVPLTRSERPITTRNYSYGPNLLITTEPEHRAPNRELPNIPATPNSKKQRQQAVKRPWTPHGNEVTNANQLLAQAVESFNR